MKPITGATTMKAGPSLPVAYAVDGAGNVWFTANSGKPRIYEMASGAY
ncbi:MAG: hypothetical protein ACYDH5_03720 [Acidimicrobiales bacterium]